MINTRAAGDSRFARTGKDGAIYNADGVLLATVDSFTANVTYNNAAYSVLGNAQELETANTFKVALTMSQVVVEDDAFIQELVEAMESQTMPVWDFQGVKSSTDQMSTSAKKANDEVTKFDRSAQKTQKSLLSWAKEKYSVLLEAKDKISPILSTIKGGLTSFGRKTWSVTMKAVDLATAPIRGVINLLKNPILQVGAVLGVSIGLKDTIDTYKDFEAAMSQVKAVSGATGSEFDKLTAKAKEMGATTKFTATQSAEAFNYMAMAGWDSQQMLDGIEGILNLAAASGEDLGTTSDIVTDALTAFGLKASDAAHFSDVLAQSAASANTNVSMMGESFKYVAPIAGAMKYSVEDTSLALGLMANSARAGKAKITIKNGSGKTHPWHLIHTDSGSNVYGWVDDGTFE